MRRDKRVLVVIPARGGSKGIPRKNITPLAGKPLISYTTDFLAELHWVDRAVVSTDDESIAEEALRARTTEVLWRPAELSGDRIGDMPVLRHALEGSESKKGEVFDVVVMLQPTSPMRTSAEVEDCVDTLLDGRWDSVWTVSESDPTFHPQKQVKFTADGALSFFDKSGPSIVARQELVPAFHRNGVCYAFTADFIRNSDSVFSKNRSTAVVTVGAHTSIDTQEDLDAVEQRLIDSRPPPEQPVDPSND